MRQTATATLPGAGRLPAAVAWWWLAVALLVAAVLPAAEPVPLVDDAAASAALVRTATAGDHGYGCDLARAERGRLFAGATAAPLPAGRYRLHAPVALAPLGTYVAATTRITLQAGDATRSFSCLPFPASDEFVDLTLDVTVARPAVLPVTLSWEVSVPERDQALAGLRQREIHAAGADAPAGAGRPPLAADDDLGLALDAEGARTSLKAARQPRFHLLGAGLHLERLAPLAVSVRLDRVTCRPGEPLGATVTVRPVGAPPAGATLRLELFAGLQPPRLLREEPLTFAGGATWEHAFAGLIPTADLYWGAELRATVVVPGQPAATARDLFAVRRNFWETAITAAHPAHLAAFDDPARARAAIRQLREQGFNGFEAFFWAPCDMLEFTPDTELFFSGQTGYPGTVTGTRNLLAAAHAEGVFGTFYANLWGGSGPPAMEVMRRHPDWFGNANYSTSTLADWDLFGPAQMAMGRHQVRMPGLATWCYSQLNVLPPEGIFRYHAAEILGSVERFGWDGIRYDSYYSRYWSVRAIRLVRELVGQARPDFGFGYNSFAFSDWRAGSLDDMIGGGGMIMGEGIRLERSRNLAGFAREVLDWRDLIWAYGGHGPGLLFRTGTDEEKFTSVGIEVEAAITLAGGGHVYYNAPPNERAQYLPFALRYSEFLYDHRLRPLAAPEALIALPDAPKLLHWPRFARVLNGPGERRRVVLHLIPEPPANDPFKDQTLAPPPPCRALTLRLSPPPGARPAGLWFLDPAPTPAHQELRWQSVTDAAWETRLPTFRYWGMVVVEFTSPAPLATPVTPKECSDTYIQDWQVIGPFANDREMTAVKTRYPPEERVDLAATYPDAGAGGRALRWCRTIADGAPARGRLPLDFRDALDRHDNAPGCAYAVTVVTSDRARDVWLRGKADDTLALWVNGAPVEFTGGVGEFQDRDEGQGRCALRAGPNVILAKVCEKWLYWLLALRLADEQGRPVSDGLTINAAALP